MAKKVVHVGPLQRLKSHVAQPKQLKNMTPRTLHACTCDYCDITYLEPADALACERWHYGAGQ
jgi:hypothetical protein